MVCWVRNIVWVFGILVFLVSMWILISMLSLLCLNWVSIVLFLFVEWVLWMFIVLGLVFWWVKIVLVCMFC